MRASRDRSNQGERVILAKCIIAGANPQPLWGLTTTVRIQRLLRAAGIDEVAVLVDDGPVLVANAHFVFDPAWIRHFASRSGEMLTLDGLPVLAACRNRAEAEAVVAAMQEADRRVDRLGLSVLRAEDGMTMSNSQLRKREAPFVRLLTPANVREVERASYFGAYKGVTDVLTKYLWPEWALVLTRWAARIGLSPNMVTMIGASFCVLTTVLFWKGQFWQGMAAGLVFMVLDTVDGKLARCTVTASRWGNVLDHGIDLIHPPFWWYAWAVGLVSFGLPLSSAWMVLSMSLILGGYALQRLVEGIFMRRFGMHIHVWRKVDSDFRLITARRNPNMVILFVATLLARPDLGIVAVALWTALSAGFHLVRLLQALRRERRGASITSWLENA